MEVLSCKTSFDSEIFTYNNYGRSTYYPALRTYLHQIIILNLKIYTDGTVVQFPNLDMLPGTKHHEQLYSSICIVHESDFCEFLCKYTELYSISNLFSRI